MSTAIYARYSTDEQRPTSIEDQVRRCRETAAKKGFEVDSKYVFKDAAVSGAEKGVGKRHDFIRLMDAIECKIIDVLVIDDVSRASRTFLEGAQLSAKVNDIGLRIITSCGIDSAEPNWELLWTMKLISAVQQVRGTADQVVRAMIGQLARGYQIAQPPFGYRSSRIFAECGKNLGALWRLEPTEATLVQQMFAWRHSGKSIAKIALELNEMNVLPPNFRRCKGAAYWRPATVHRLLTNAIYKGVFVWNDSSFARARAKKRRKTLEVKEFPRPELRLVSDDVWNECNKRHGETRIRGGGQNALAGVLSCGYCHARLSISGLKKSQSICCPQCEQAKRVGGHENFMGHSSLAAAKLAMHWSLEKVFSKEVIAEFHERLQERLTLGPAKEEAELKQQLEQIELTLARLKRLIQDPNIDESELRSSMAESVSKKKEAQGLLTALLLRSTQVTKAAVEFQSKVDPLPLLRNLIDGEPEAYKVRATLKRLISRFELVAKRGRNCSVYELTFVPGVGVAEASGTDTLDSEGVSYRVTVSTTAKRPVVWEVFGERI